MGLLNMRDPSGDNGAGPAPAHTYPIARWFAFVILAALIGLFALHHIVFNVSASGGVK
jgi:hypothetical protein